MSQLNVTIPGLPLFSTTEERVFKQCRLAHHFEYDLKFRRVVANRKLSTGILIHEGVGAYYLGEDPFVAIDTEAAKQWKVILAADPAGAGYAEALSQFNNDLELVHAMMSGYLLWVKESGVDDDWDTVEAEVSHLIQVPDFPCAIPVRMDLVQRNKTTGRLRVVDHKTARSIPTDMSGYQLAEQNGNYQLAVLALYDEMPTELAYNFLRKIIPSARTKPPYFDRISIRLTPEELRARLEELRTVATERFDPDRAIYSAPDGCCGSWKNDWRAPCMKVHAGMTPLEALEASAGYEPADAYKRYDDLEEEE